MNKKIGASLLVIAISFNALTPAAVWAGPNQERSGQRLPAAQMGTSSAVRLPVLPPTLVRQSKSDVAGIDLKPDAVPEAAASQDHEQRPSALKILADIQPVTGPTKPEASPTPTKFELASDGRRSEMTEVSAVFPEAGSAQANAPAATLAPARSAPRRVAGRAHVKVLVGIAAAVLLGGAVFFSYRNGSRPEAPLTPAELRHNIAEVSTTARAAQFKAVGSYSEYQRKLAIAFGVRPQVREAWNQAEAEIFEEIDPAQYKPRSQAVADDILTNVMLLSSMELAEAGHKEAAAEAAVAAVEGGAMLPESEFDGLLMEIEELAVKTAAGETVETAELAVKIAYLKKNARAHIWYDRKIAKPVSDEIDKIKEKLKRKKEEPKERPIDKK